MKSSHFSSRFSQSNPVPSSLSPSTCWAHDWISDLLIFSEMSFAAAAAAWSLANGLLVLIQRLTRREQGSVPGIETLGTTSFLPNGDRSDRNIKIVQKYRHHVLMEVINKRAYLNPTHPNYDTTTESHKISSCQSEVHSIPTEMFRLMEIDGFQK